MSYAIWRPFYLNRIEFRVNMQQAFADNKFSKKKNKQIIKMSTA